MQYHPDLAGGANHILAIMFDMNALWESYIFQMIARANRVNAFKYEVRPQPSEPFWHNPAGWPMQLNPDIVVKCADQTAVVLDAKWKYESRTSTQDVRQMYAYGHYFAANKRYLLYPYNGDQGVAKQVGGFYTRGDKTPSTDNICGLIYVNILNADGSLNLDIGALILESV